MSRTVLPEPAIADVTDFAPTGVPTLDPWTGA